MALVSVVAVLPVLGLEAGQTADVDDSGEAAYMLATGWLRRLDPVQIGSSDAPPPELVADQRLDLSGLDALRSAADAAAAEVA